MRIRITPLLHSIAVTSLLQFSVLGSESGDGPVPVTASASPEARALLQVLYSISGEHTLTGQHNYPNTKDTYTLRTAQVCGKVPAVFGQDFGFAAPGNQDAAAARPDVIAEIKRQVVLLDWAHNQFKKFGRPSVEALGALEILKGIEEGQSFFCVQYAHLYASAAASLGWVDRELALRRHQDPLGGGSTEHLTTELWCNQHRKWVMMDPTANLHIEKDGIPLNGFGPAGVESHEPVWGSRSGLRGGDRTVRL
jgi:hypothetical protein